MTLITKPKEPVDYDKLVKLNFGDVSVPELPFVEYQPGLRKNVYIYPLFDNTVNDPKGSDANGTYLSYLA